MEDKWFEDRKSVLQRKISETKDANLANRIKAAVPKKFPVLVDDKCKKMMEELERVRAQRLKVEQDNRAIMESYKHQIQEAKSDLTRLTKENEEANKQPELKEKAKELAQGDVVMQLIRSKIESEKNEYLFEDLDARNDNLAQEKEAQDQELEDLGDQLDDLDRELEEQKDAITMAKTNLVDSKIKLVDRFLDCLESYSGAHFDQSVTQPDKLKSEKNSVLLWLHDAQLRLGKTRMQLEHEKMLIIGAVDEDDIEVNKETGKKKIIHVNNVNNFIESKKEQ